MHFLWPKALLMAPRGHNVHYNMQVLDGATNTKNATLVLGMVQEVYLYF